MAEKKTFSLTSKIESAATVVTISGPIDETAVFAEFRNEGSVKVDLGGVTRINSVGMRAWCLWLQRFREPANVVLINCPVVMVKNFATVRGFLTDRCRVFSFAVPFYSELTGERKDFMATWGEDFSKGSIKLPKMKDSEGNPMELDVPESYFGFLKA